MYKKIELEMSDLSEALLRIIENPNLPNDQVFTSAVLQKELEENRNIIATDQEIAMALGLLLRVRGAECLTLHLDANGHFILAKSESFKITSQPK